MVSLYFFLCISLIIRAFKSYEYPIPQQWESIESLMWIFNTGLFKLEEEKEHFQRNLLYH